jgi:predicted transcriptional regulator
MLYAFNITDMPAAMSLTKRLAVKGMLEVDLEHQAIATKVKCNERTVRRINKNLVDFGSVKRLNTSQRGPKPKLTQQMKDVCLSECIL